MSTYEYKNSAGTTMVRMIADVGYKLTKDDRHFKTIVYCPVEEKTQWKEVKGQK